jgi:putative transposase
MRNTQAARLLAFVTGMVNQQLLLRNEYLIAENRILRAQLPGRLRLTDAQRSTLEEIGKRLGRRAGTGGLSSQAGNDPGLVSQADCPQIRWLQAPSISGTAGVEREVVELIVRIARENRSWDTTALQEP